MADNNNTTKNDRPPFKRAWFWVTIVISFALFIFSLVLTTKAAMKIDNADTNRVTLGGSLTIDSNLFDDDDEEDTMRLYAPNETGEVGGLAITINSIERNFSTGNRFDTPDEGMEYIKINLTLTNKSKDRIEYNPFDFELENGEGDIQDYATSLQEDHLGSGSLASGGKKTGSLVFEVPAKDTNLTLYYEDYTNGEAGFRLY